MARTRKITDQQKRAIEMKLEPGVSDGAIARELGVARGTVSRWWARPDIKAVLSQKRAEIEAAMPTAKDRAIEWAELGNMAKQALYDILSGKECFEGRDKEGKPYYYAAPPNVVHSAAKTALAKIKPDLKAIEHTGEVAQNHEGTIRQIVVVERDAVRGARSRLTKSDNSK